MKTEIFCYNVKKGVWKGQGSDFKLENTALSVQHGGSSCIFRVRVTLLVFTCFSKLMQWRENLLMSSMSPLINKFWLKPVPTGQRSQTRSGWSQWNMLSGMVPVSITSKLHQASRKAVPVIRNSVLSLLMKQTHFVPDLCVCSCFNICCRRFSFTGNLRRSVSLPAGRTSINTTQ